MKYPTILTAAPTTTANALAYSLAPDAAVLLMDDGSARILDMADRFYAVSAIGALMLRQTLQHGRAAAARHVADTYGVALARVEGDLDRLLAALEQRGILRRQENDAGRQRRRVPAASLAARLLNVLLRRLPSPKAQAAALLTLAKLSLRLFGWSATTTAWRRQFPLRSARLSARQAEETALAIDEAVCSAAAVNPFGVACKERSLCCWALARGAGLPAALVIGVELFPLVGHCWCEVGGHILSDHPDNAACYIPVLRYV